MVVWRLGIGPTTVLCLRHTIRFHVGRTASENWTLKIEKGRRLYARTCDAHLSGKFWTMSGLHKTQRQLKRGERRRWKEFDGLLATLNALVRRRATNDHEEVVGAYRHVIRVARLLSLIGPQ